MAIKTRTEYLEALRQLRPNIYKFGELIEDVTTHPATKRTVESHALNYDAAHDPELEDIYTATSIFSGEKVLRWNSMMQEPEDLIMNMRMKRQNYRRTGSCTGGGLRGLECHECDVGCQQRDRQGTRHRLSGPA